MLANRNVAAAALALGAVLAACDAHPAAVESTAVVSGYDLDFDYELVDEVVAVDTALGLFVLAGGARLFVDDGVQIDSTGDFTTLAQVAAALARHQRVSGTSHFRVEYQVVPYDVDVFLETVRFDLVFF